MKEINVFEGEQLYAVPLRVQAGAPLISFYGADGRHQPASLPMDQKILSHHVLLLGGIGTGKTTSIIQALQQLHDTLREDDIAIIFDTKGEFYERFYRPGDIVISNDSTATDYWNIFNELREDERLEENITEIANAFFQQRIHTTSQPFFPSAARDLFFAILLHMCRDKSQENPDNAMLRAFLDQATGAVIREVLNTHDDLRAMVSYISGDASDQTQGVISELQQVAREIFIGNFKKPGALSMRDIVRKKGGKFVFVEYDLGIGSMLSPVYSLLFDMAIKEALCRTKSEGNVFFIVDEFRLLPHLQHIDDAVNFGRSLGVKFMIGIQNVGQVYESYGHQRGRSILSGFSTNISFRVQDSASRQYIKGLYGRNRKKVVYSSAVQGRGIIENVRDASVVEDWDISQLELGQAIIGLPGTPPFLFRFSET